MIILNPANGYVYDLSSDIYNAVPKENFVISSLNLFTQENHAVNRVAIQRLIADQSQMLLENKRSVHSDFNAVRRPFGAAYLYDMKYFSAINSVESHDVEQYVSRKSMARQQAIGEVLSDLAIEQVKAYDRTKEKYLQEAILGGMAYSDYADQGDLNFYTEFGQSKTTTTLDISDTANIPAQLDNVWRVIRKASLEQAGNLQSVVVLCTGDVANAIRYHPSITQAMLYVLGSNDPSNFYTQFAEALPGYTTWKFKGFSFVDVTGDAALEAYIGESGAVFIPKFSESAGVYTLHTGVGVKHATLGQELGETHQYVTTDDKWSFPTVAFEASVLPLVQLPQAIVFATANIGA